MYPEDVCSELEIACSEQRYEVCIHVLKCQLYVVFEVFIQCNSLLLMVVLLLSAVLPPSHKSVGGLPLLWCDSYYVSLVYTCYLTGVSAALIVVKELNYIKDTSSSCVSCSSMCLVLYKYVCFSIIISSYLLTFI